MSCLNFVVLMDFCCNLAGKVELAGTEGGRFNIFERQKMYFEKSTHKIKSRILYFNVNG